MANTFLTNIDLNKNELQNAIIQPLAAAPLNPKEGQIYYNSTDKFIYRYNGTAWGPIGVVYSQNNSTGAVITGLSNSGSVTTTNVKNLTLTGYTAVDDGYVSAGMTLQQAISALDEAIKGAVAGNGEINQNAFSIVKVGESTIQADTKTDTLELIAGNNITLTPNITNDSVTIVAKDTTYNDATTSAHGLMSAEDKAKLDGIAEQANKYTHPSHTSKASGLYKITVDSLGHVSAATAVTKSDITGLGIPESDTTYGTGNATTSGLTKLYTSTGTNTDGTMTQSAIKTALDGKATSAQGTKADNAMPKSGGTFTGAITLSGAPTSDLHAATKKYVDDKVSGLVDSAPETLDTLKELSTALGDDPNFATTVANQIGGKVDKVEGKGLSTNDFTTALKNKLDGIASQATKNSITLNGSANANPSFYAATAVGSSGQVLTSNGSGAPSWATPIKKYTATNGALTANGGIWTWSIAAATHGLANNALTVQIYEVATGEQVFADVTINQTNFNISIVINDTAGANSLAAGKYRVVIIG